MDPISVSNAKFHFHSWHKVRCRFSDQKVSSLALRLRSPCRRLNVQSALPGIGHSRRGALEGRIGAGVDQRPGCTSRLPRSVASCYARPNDRSNRCLRRLRVVGIAETLVRLIPNLSKAKKSFSLRRCAGHAWGPKGPASVIRSVSRSAGGACVGGRADGAEGFGRPFGLSGGGRRAVTGVDKPRTTEYTGPPNHAFRKADARSDGAKTAAGHILK